MAYDRIRGNIFLADFRLAFKHGTPVRHKWQSPAVFCGPERWYDQSRKPHEKLTLEAIARRARPEVADVEMRTALSVFAKGLAYLPEKRPSAAELLRDHDFNALMKTYEC